MHGVGLEVGDPRGQHLWRHDQLPGCRITVAAQDNATNGPTGLPVVTGKVTINGNGATIARQASTASTPVPAFRLLNVAAGGSLTLSGLALGNGFADDGTNGGGAIFSLGTVHVSGVFFSGNRSRPRRARRAARSAATAAAPR